MPEPVFHDFLLEEFSDLFMTLPRFFFTPQAVSMTNICHCLYLKVTLHIFAFFGKWLILFPEETWNFMTFQKNSKMFRGLEEGIFFNALTFSGIP